MLSKHLDDAGKAFRAKDREAALGHLLKAWRACRSPALEELIDIVSEDLARSTEPLDTEDDDFDAAWDELERRGRAGDIEHLLPGLHASPKQSIPLRVRSLLGRGPDPRVGRAFVDMIASPPMTSSSMFSTWTKIFAALPDYADARCAKVLAKRAKKHDGKSQFWPKLTKWIKAASLELPKAARLERGTGPQVKELVKAARRFAGGPPMVLGERAAKSRSAAAPTLAGAAAQLRSGDHADAIETLRQFWAQNRAAPVAVAIERLGAILDDQRPALSEGKAKAVHSRWMELGENDPSAADVGRLLGALLAGNLGDVEERLAAMTRWQPDPRIAANMFLFIGDPMIGARPLLWRSVYQLLLINADPRLADQFAAMSANIGQPSILQRRQAMASALRRVQERADAAFADEATLNVNDQQTMSDISSAIDTIAAERGAAGRDDRERFDSLLDAIVSDPAKDGPRLVMSDWLLEQGDPSGEFIALSVGLANGKRVKGKLEKFEKKHKSHLLGPLEPLINDCEFERGFLKSARLDLGKGQLGRSKPKVDAMIGDWRWSTIEELTGSYREGGLGQILAGAPLRSLRKLHRVSLRTLSEVGSEMPLEAVAVRDFDNAEWSNWSELDRVAKNYLKSVRTIWFAMHSPAAEFFETSLAGQLDRIIVGRRSTGGIPEIDVWIRRLYAGNRGVQRLLIQPAYALANVESIPGQDRFRLELTLARLHRQDHQSWNTLLEVVRRIPARAIAETTCSMNLPDGDERRGALLEALAHLSPREVEFVQPEWIEGI